MQSNTPRDRLAREDRAAGPAREAGSAPSSQRRASAAGSTRKPSGFATLGAARKRAPGGEAQPKTPVKAKRRLWEREPNHRRKRKKHRPIPWKIVLIVAGGVILLALIVAVIVANSGKTYHQLPRITRIEDYTPEPLATPEATAESEAIPMLGSDGLPGIEDFSGADGALSDTDGAFSDADSFFDEDSFLEDAAALEDSLGLAENGLPGDEAGAEGLDSFADAFLGDEAGA